MKHDDTGRFSRTSVWTLAISALVLLVLAGLFYYWANPSDPDQYTRVPVPFGCWNPWTGPVMLLMGLIALIGGAIAVVGAGLVLQSRIWINAVLPLFGISLLLWGIAAYILIHHGSPESMCND